MFSRRSQARSASFEVCAIFDFRIAVFLGISHFGDPGGCNLVPCFLCKLSFSEENARKIAQLQKAQARDAFDTVPSLALRANVAFFRQSLDDSEVACHACSGDSSRNLAAWPPCRCPRQRRLNRLERAQQTRSPLSCATRAGSPSVPRAAKRLGPHGEASDGSQRHSITDTRQYNEAGGRFSPDGRRILYYRMQTPQAVDKNDYGTHELVIADADGAHATSYGRGLSWAPGARMAGNWPAWTGRDPRHRRGEPGGRAAISPPRHRPTVAWSPDGKWFVGRRTDSGPFWNIGRIDAATGTVNAVSETDRYNCTPDWMPDSGRIVYARGIVPEKGGWAELWAANGDGGERSMRYAEEGRHIYGPARRRTANISSSREARRTWAEPMTRAPLDDRPLGGYTYDRGRKCQAHEVYPHASRGPDWISVGDGSRTGNVVARQSRNQSTKHEIPNPKQIRSSKWQCSKLLAPDRESAFWISIFRHWELFEIWDLVLGISCVG